MHIGGSEKYTCIFLRSDVCNGKWNFVVLGRTIIRTSNITRPILSILYGMPWYTRVEALSAFALFHMLEEALVISRQRDGASVKSLLHRLGVFQVKIINRPLY